MYASLSLARRDTRLARRESCLARRDSRLARRDSRLARRESRLARRETRGGNLLLSGTVDLTVFHEICSEHSLIDVKQNCVGEFLYFKYFPHGGL